MPSLFPCLLLVLFCCSSQSCRCCGCEYIRASVRRCILVLDAPVAVCPAQRHRECRALSKIRIRTGHIVALALGSSGACRHLYCFIRTDTQSSSGLVSIRKLFVQGVNMPRRSLTKLFRPYPSSIHTSSQTLDKFSSHLPNELLLPRKRTIWMVSANHTGLRHTGRGGNGKYLCGVWCGSCIDESRTLRSTGVLRPKPQRLQNNMLDVLDHVVCEGSCVKRLHRENTGKYRQPHWQPLPGSLSLDLSLTPPT